MSNPELWSALQASRASEEVCPLSLNFGWRLLTLVILDMSVHTPKNGPMCAHTVIRLSLDPTTLHSKYDLSLSTLSILTLSGIAAHMNLSKMASQFK